MNQNQTAQERWEACLDLLRTKLPQKTFDTWIVPLEFVSHKENELTLSVPNKFVRDFIEEHCIHELHESLKATFGDDIRLLYALRRNQVLEPEPVKSVKHESKLPPLDPQLNHRYAFENFVEGKSNKLALTVALAIANNPPQPTFNPLFVYGPSGIGKTHLANAIGIRVREKFPNKRVLFVPVHVFKTQYTESVKLNTTNDFIAFYQSIDVLIIDDIQELTTPKTQQTFFHIFNHLHQNNRHIVITCDRAPSQIEGMDDRMLSRFKWGITAEIERPDIQLRIDILKSKIYRDGLSMNDSVVSYIAKNVSSSVRELEGVVNSMMAYSIMDNCEIDIKLAASVIARTVKSEGAELTLDDIVQTICKHFGLKQKDLLSKSRKQNIVQARQLAMHLAKKHLELSFSQIGQRIGKRDHTTVLHACNQVAARLSTDKTFRAEMEEIETQLKH